jgi:hypothetical protein
MARNPYTQAPQVVRDFLSSIGKKGGATGPGTEKSKAKTRNATAKRVADAKAPYLAKT